MSALLDEIIPLPARSPEWPWTGRRGELPAHLSASQLSMFERCPEQWRRRYVLHDKERPAAALVWGSADHEAHELNFRQKIASHEDIPVDDVKVAFAEAFDRRAAEDDIDWGDDGPDKLKDAGVELVAAYHRQVSPTVQPVDVEKQFELVLPGVPVPVHGRIDVVTELPAIERKTAKSKPARDEAKPSWRVQGILYQLVEQRPVAWHVSVKTKTPAVYTPAEMPGLAIAVDARRLAVARALIRTTAGAIRSFYDRFGPEQAWPGALGDDWACSYCGFKQTCAWWGNA